MAHDDVLSKDDLLDLVAARALADVSAPAGADVPWPERLRALINPHRRRRFGGTAAWARCCWISNGMARSSTSCAP